MCPYEPTLDLSITIPFFCAVLLTVFLIANIFRCKIYSFAAMCTKHKHTRKHRHSTHFLCPSRLPSLHSLLSASLAPANLAAVYFYFIRSFILHVFRFVRFVSESRQFINIKFCSALFSVWLPLALFRLSVCVCVRATSFFSSLFAVFLSHSLSLRLLLIAYIYYLSVICRESNQKHRKDTKLCCKVCTKQTENEKKKMHTHTHTCTLRCTLKWKEAARESNRENCRPEEK